MSALVPHAAPRTMSSREIAELTGKQHQHVRRDIEGMCASLEIDASSFGQTYRDSQNREQPEYALPKRETLILVSGYSVELRARIVDRWEELERQVASGPKSRALPAREVRAQFKFGLSIAQQIGLLGNQALLAANGLTRQTTGVDVLEAMGQERLIAPQQEALLTATDIGRELGGLSAIKVNHLLSTHGFQIGQRDWKGKTSWEPTERGIEAGGVMLDVGRGNGTGNSRQLRWASSVVDALREIGAA